MPLRPVFALLHVNIHNMDVRGNPLLNVTGNGESYISQADSSQQSPSLQVPRVPSHDSYNHNSNVHGVYTSMERRVEAQTRIRRKLDEACARPGSIFGIDVVAQLATDILSLIESKPSAFGVPLVNLAMDAHAVAYIALISCSVSGFGDNGRRKIRRKDVRRLRRLLNSVYTLLVEEAPEKGILTQIKRVFGKGRRNGQVLLMREKLLDILRDIERDEHADILKSLSSALDCSYQ